MNFDFKSVTKIFENDKIKLGIIAVVVFFLIFSIVSGTQDCSNSPDSGMTVNKLDELYNNLDVKTLTPRKENVDLAEVTGTNLPDISNYPFVVAPITDSFIEIFSSPEKAGSGYESWLIDAGNQFNQSGVTINGIPVSVGIRNISSGLGVDYIVSGIHIPDVFAPSNKLWGDMLKYKGIDLNLAEESIAGNVAGIVLSKSKNDELIKKYGSINSKIVVEAVLNGELIMGYTNPFASSTGLNFLLTTLYTLDVNNPLGNTSISLLQKFQDNIPYVAYNTMQMKESAKSGSLDGFVLEYQTYINSPDIKSDYTFTPFGVRHDQPVYEIGEPDRIKKDITRLFIDYCKSDKMQALASEKGFNGMNGYVYELPNPDGMTISQAQKIWKKEKNGTSDLTVVFVADISGSMDGPPIISLKNSLYSSAKFINPETHVGLVTFSDNVNIALPIAKFDLNQRAFFTGAVKDMQAGGGTAMFDAIVVASKMLRDAKEQNPNTKLMLFVLTDGDTNRGYTLNDIEDVLREIKIPIYTIGYNADVSVLQNVSGINEAATINADTDDVIYKLESLFNAQT